MAKPYGMPATQYFLEHLGVDDSGCWPWRGRIQPNGYGIFSLTNERRPVYAHRFAYEFLVGPIPVGLTIDHLCRTRSCCNTDHMEVVTRAENARRGRHGTRTHCPHGHAYTASNTVLRGGVRRCRICLVAHKRRELDKRIVQRLSPPGALSVSEHKET